VRSQQSVATVSSANRPPHTHTTPPPLILPLTSALPGAGVASPSSSSWARSTVAECISRPGGFEPRQGTGAPPFAHAAHASLACSSTRTSAVGPAASVEPPTTTMTGRSAPSATVEGLG
jgi:hypothetical protein